MLTVPSAHNLHARWLTQNQLPEGHRTNIVNEQCGKCEFATNLN